MNLRSRVFQPKGSSASSSVTIRYARTNDLTDRTTVFFRSNYNTLCSMIKLILFATFFFFLGGRMLSNNNNNNVSYQRIFQQSQEGSEKINNQELESLPIVQSGPSKGFYPVYVYSNAKNTQKLKQKKTYSQAKQDLLILALMDANDSKQMEQSQKPHTGALRPTKTTESKNSKNNRYFVDLAANDAVEYSNTLLLEHHGWKGLCIEPNPIYWYRLASYRSCTIVGAVVGGTPNQNGEEVDVKFSNGVFGGIVGKNMDNKNKRDKNLQKRNLVSIPTVFEETNTPTLIDYFSLDVEGAESLVMQDFPWHSYAFKFITIERPKEDLVTMLNSNGYVKVMNVTSWGETLWIHIERTALTVDEINQIYADKKHLQCKKCH